MLKMRLVLLLAFFFVVGALARPSSEEKSKEKNGDGKEKKSGEVIVGPGISSGENGNDSSCDDSGSNESGKSNQSKRSTSDSDEDSSSGSNSDESNSADAEDTSYVNTPHNNALSNELTKDVSKVVNEVEKSSAFHFLQQINPLNIALKIPILGRIIRAIISIICIPVKFVPYALNAISSVFDTASHIVPGV